MEDVRYLPAVIGTRAMHEDLPEDDDDKYWIRVTASNGEVDKHNSIMDPETTLRNFEKDAKSELGVALKDHHAYKSFGYGRSEDARLTDSHELLIDFFILKDMEYDGSGREFRTPDKLIRGIQHGLVNQVSVGFYGGREVCNLCKLPVRKWYYWDERETEYCSHRMGKAYDMGKGKMVTATYTVYDARLKEVSLVEFGSNRGTSIQKKREFMAVMQSVFSGDTDAELTAAFSAGMRSFLEEQLMTDQEWIAKLREVLDVPTIRSTDEPEAVVEKLESEVSGLREKVETQKDEIADLTSAAEDGKAYREARIEEAIKQGNRAYGNDFDAEFHREYYADLPLDKLESQIAHNKKLGDTALPAGRSTTDTHDPPAEKDKSSVRDRKRRYRKR